MPLAPLRWGATTLANPYAAAAHSYKGALHFHTTGSDGANTPTEMLAAYAAAGFDFAAITDHDVITADPGGSGLLVIPGVEQSADWHWGVIGASVVVPITADPQTAIDAHRASGALVWCAHPYYYDFMTVADAAGPSGLIGLEVFNDSCHVANGRGNAESVWDAALAGRRYWGLAVDDAHAVSRAAKAWVVVHADALSEAAILAALAAGNFYSTQGPSVAVTVAGLAITATTAAAATIDWIVLGGRVAQTSPNATSDTYTAQPTDQYVRVRVTRDSDGLMAWSNPLWVSRVKS
ncbi:MAG: CehA/McbA family metallohydrolase [Acidobacteria bacterium]|nr:CehA/McbA family metallohydrolase [Acidobacteriota bacterium]